MKRFLISILTLLLLSSPAFSATLTQEQPYDPANVSITGGTISGPVATTSATGVVELSTAAETVAGTGTTRATTDAGVSAAIAVNANPKAMSQAVAMTAAASGSSGITVADSDHIDFGTGNFTLVWKGSLPNWATDTVLISKFYDSVNSWYLRPNYSAGKLSLRWTKTGGTTVAATTTASFTGIAGEVKEITAVVTRETAGTPGSVVFYVNGVLFESVTVAAGTPADISNSSSLMLLGYSDVRYAGRVHHAYTFNRALTAAEVLDLYRNGIAEADKWGSQTSLNVSSCANAGGADGYSPTFDGASAAGFHVVSGGSSGYDCAGTADELPFVLGKNYVVEFDFVLTSGTNPYVRLDTNFLASTVASAYILTGSGHYSLVYLANQTTTGGVNFYNNTTATEYTVSNLSVKYAGATLALEPEGIQPAPGQWLDSSSNKLHAMQPAAGSSLTRPKKEFEYRWTNTWTTSSAAQYIGGLNQAVLSADHFITSISTQATVTTDVENLTLGDGSNAARFVATFAPSATRTSQTIAAQNDGMNLKLVYTPAAEATMTVETIIRGFIWEP